MKPTMGRIVIYREVVAVGGEDLMPAIVQGVEQDGTLRLCVFGRFSQSMRYNVKEGTEEGTWQWPPRV